MSNEGYAHDRAAESARRCNYWLLGKDNLTADRTSGDAIRKFYAGVVRDAQANRQFHQRAIRWLMQDKGFAQILDIDCGFPMGDGDDTHDIAQGINPEARVVYVDSDPTVMVHARALRTSHHERENVGYVEADLRDPWMILDGAGGTLDLSRPVAVLRVAVLHSDRPFGAVQTLMQALPVGSALVLTHASMELASQKDQAAFSAVDLADVPGGSSFTNLPEAEVEQLFAPLTFFDDYPGVVPIDQWHPEYGTDTAPDPDQTAAVYGGAAYKT